MDLFTLYRQLLPVAGFCLVMILLTVWARRRNQRGKGSGTLVPIFRAIQWLGIIILVLDLGWLGGYWLSEIERPLHITSPFNDQVINLRQQVKGNYKELSGGQMLWVVVAPFHTSNYYPQQNPAILQPDGTWSSLTFVGSAGDAGRAFDILLVLVDAQGQQAFNNYLSDTNQHGLNGLPPGVTIVDKVTVWRK